VSEESGFCDLFAFFLIFGFDSIPKFRDQGGERGRSKKTERSFFDQPPPSSRHLTPQSSLRANYPNSKRRYHFPLIYHVSQLEPKPTPGPDLETDKPEEETPVKASQNAFPSILRTVYDAIAANSVCARSVCVRSPFVGSLCWHSPSHVT